MEAQTCPVLHGGEPDPASPERPRCHGLQQAPRAHRAGGADPAQKVLQDVPQHPGHRSTSWLRMLSTGLANTGDKWDKW